MIGKHDSNTDLTAGVQEIRPDTIINLSKMTLDYCDNTVYDKSVVILVYGIVGWTTTLLMNTVVVK